MFSSIIIKSLITKYVTIDSAITIEGTKMIIDGSSDFQNPEELLTQMKNANIDSISLQGSNINTFPNFIGFQMVKTFECYCNCYSIPQYYFYRNQIIRTVSIGSNVREIEKAAFAYSTLESIEFASTTDVSTEAFAYCTRLNILNIPNVGESGYRNTNLQNIIISASYIQENSFRECYNLESVTFTKTEITIEKNAFKDCFNLRTINFQENVKLKKVNDCAFENCQIESMDLKSVTIIGTNAFKNNKFKKLVLNNLEVGDYAFAYCDELTELEVEQNIRPSTVYSFFSSKKGVEFFYSCQKLETVILGPQTNNIYPGMFKNCINLREFRSSAEDLTIGFESFFSCWSLTKIPTNINEIEENAFMFCKSLETIDLSNCNTIKNRAFYGCEKLKNVNPQVLGDDYSFAFCNSLVSCNVQTFAGTGLLMNCSNLESVTLNNIQYIPKMMFFGCTKLRSITWPDILKGIGHYAFIGTNIEIPDFNFPDLGEIGKYALKGVTIEKIKFSTDYIYFRKDCDRQYVVVCPAVPETDENPFDGLSTVTEIVLGENVREFKAVDFVNCHDFKIKLEGTHLRIEDGMLRNDTDIFYCLPTQNPVKLTIPESINKIHTHAFTTSNVEEIVINHYIENMYKAFKDCKSLKTITINFNEQYKSLDNYIFENCVSLTTVNLCPRFTRFGDYSFRGCSSLETITIPEGTNTLGEYCFAECSSLKNIIFPENQLSIYRYCFYKCTALTYINLTKELYMSENIFDSSGLKSVTISVSNLHNSGIFDMSYNLQKVEIVGDSDSYGIGRDCFNSTSLTEIKLPTNLSSLGNKSFGYTKLKTFFIPKTLTEINSQAFYGCEDIRLELECDHPKYILGAHEVIDKNTKTLLFTYGKLLSTYIVPSIVKRIEINSINSYPKYNETSRKVIDFGLTTLVIRSKVEIRDPISPVYNGPYLHNLCYGGNVKIKGFDDTPRIFVSDYYNRRIWSQHPRKYPIFSECDSSVPFENYAKYDYTYPKNPNYKPLPKNFYSDDIKDCGKFDDPEPEISDTPSNSEFSVVDSTETSSTPFKGDEGIPEIDKVSPLTYILLAIATLQIITIAGLVAFLIHKKKEESSDASFVEMSEHMITNLSTEVTFTNPLFTMNTNIEDDPFASDFEEDRDNEEEGFFKECLHHDE